MGKIVNFFDHVRVESELVERLDRIAAQSIRPRRRAEPDEEERTPRRRTARAVRKALRIRKFRW